MTGGDWDTDSHWSSRSGWGVGWETRRWLKSFIAAIPGGIGSFMRCRLYGIGSIGRDVKLSEGLWLEYPGRLRIGNHVGVNRECFFSAAGGLTVDDWVLIGPRVVIYTSNHDVSGTGVPIALLDDVCEPVFVGRGAWIGAGAIVLPGVRIGEEAVVAAGAVVTKDVADRTIVAGVPASVVRSRPCKDASVVSSS